MNIFIPKKLLVILAIVGLLAAINSFIDLMNRGVPLWLVIGGIVLLLCATVRWNPKRRKK